MGSSIDGLSCIDAQGELILVAGNSCKTDNCQLFLLNKNLGVLHKLFVNSENIKSSGQPMFTQFNQNLSQGRSLVSQFRFITSKKKVPKLAILLLSVSYYFLVSISNNTMQLIYLDYPQFGRLTNGYWNHSFCCNQEDQQIYFYGSSHQFSSCFIGCTQNQLI